MMMMGYAYQKGMLPLSAKSIEQAIEVNGVAIKMNTQAFQLGRLAAADPAKLVAMMKGQDDTVAPKTLDAMSLDEIIAHRSALLTDYQDAKLADRYRSLVTKVRNAALDGGYGDALPRAVAINYAKLLAYKDEYEVARLFTDGRFEKQLRDQFDGDFKFNFNLAPPLLGGGKDALGRPKKRSFRRLDDAGIPHAGEDEGPARHRLRHLRLQRRPQAGTRSDRRLTRRTSPPCSACCRRSRWIPRSNSFAARPHPRLRPGEGEGGARRQGALCATRRRPRQPAAGATADRGGVGGGIRSHHRRPGLEPDPYRVISRLEKRCSTICL